MPRSTRSNRSNADPSSPRSVRSRGDENLMLPPSPGTPGAASVRSRRTRSRIDPTEVIPDSSSMPPTPGRLNPMSPFTGGKKFLFSWVLMRYLQKQPAAGCVGISQCRNYSEFTDAYTKNKSGGLVNIVILGYQSGLQNEG